MVSDRIRHLFVCLLFVAAACKKREPISLAPEGGGGTGALVASATPAPASTIDAGGIEADKEALKKAKVLVGSIESSVAKHTLSDPASPGEDAKMKCAAFDEQKAALEKQTDPEAKGMVEKARQLCAFDVPLLAATDVLDQMKNPRSQASKLLFCTSAEREIKQARAVKPNDPQVRKVYGRWVSLCRT